MPNLFRSLVILLMWAGGCARGIAQEAVSAHPLSGDARLVGVNSTPTTAGQTGTLVQAGSRPGAITVQASTPGLRSGTLAIRSQP